MSPTSCCKNCFAPLEILGAGSCSRCSSNELAWLASYAQNIRSPPTPIGIDEFEDPYVGISIFKGLVAVVVTTKAPATVALAIVTLGA